MTDVSTEPDTTARQALSVTMVIVTYNQEAYIRAAIESALAQTIRPGEILVSDDCSQDRTWEIIREVAAEHTGAITINRNERNLGLIEHINLVLDRAKGDLIVLAAGDDLSEPNRVETIVTAANDHPDALLFHSRATTINAQGEVVGTLGPTAKVIAGDLDYIAQSTGLHLGATAALRRRLIGLFPPIGEKETYEDLTWGFRAALWSDLQFIDAELMRYRIDTGFSSKTDYFAQSPGERLRHFETAMATYRQRLSDLDWFERQTGNVLPAIRQKLTHQLNLALCRRALIEAPGRFLFGTFPRSPYYSLRALFSEAKYALKARKVRQ